jgi:hypothetical protein
MPYSQARPGRCERQPGRDFETTARGGGVGLAAEQLAAFAHAKIPGGPAGPRAVGARSWGRRVRARSSAGAVQRPSSVTRISRTSFPGFSATVTRVGPAWRITFVIDSCRIRYAALPTALGNGVAGEVASSVTSSPASRALAVSSSICPRPGCGMRPSLSSRSTPRMARISRSARELVCSMASSASRACSGRLSSTCAVTPDWTLMIAMACATVSWTSRAMRSRSASTRARASSSRDRSAS